MSCAEKTSLCNIRWTVSAFSWRNIHMLQLVVRNLLLLNLVMSFWIVKCQTGFVCVIIMKTSSCYWKLCAKFILTFQVILASLLQNLFVLNLQNIAQTMCVMNEKMASCSIILQMGQLIGFSERNKCELTIKMNLESWRVIPLNKLCKNWKCRCRPLFCTIILSKNSQLHISNISINFAEIYTTQSAFTCSKLTIEMLEQGVKYVQS